ncbi:hypothetical protein BH11PSE11_BH11PSE11_01630 [soil metagenome]
MAGPGASLAKALPTAALDVSHVLRCIFFALCLAISVAAFATNPIQVENGKAGTTSWMIPSLSPNQADMEGYASANSVNRGGSIKFFISTTSPSYTINVYRLGWYGGSGGRQMLGPISRAGFMQPRPAATAFGLKECNWSDPYTLVIPNNSADPSDWASGIYVAKLTASGGAQNYIVFTVRDDNRAPAADFIFQSSVNTWQAYNNWGGQSLYSSNSVGNTPARKVSFNRPYAVDGSGDLFQWEINMLRFLEREGYDVTYSTDVDLHEQGFALIAPHKTFLSVGHDEYWSYQMKTAVHQVRDAGKHLGFFGADAIYWQIRYEPSTIGPASNRTLVAFKEAAQSSDPFWLDGIASNDKYITARFRDLVAPPYNVQDPITQPENGLIGVMYQGSPVDGDIMVSDPNSWVYAGTGVSAGSRFVGLLGYEADAMFNNGYAPAGLKKVADSPEQFGNAHMVTYTAPSGSVIFSTGTMQWLWGLDDYGAPYRSPSRLDPAAQQVTRNVLARFLMTRPDAPTNVVATAGDAQASVSFSAPAGTGGSPVTGYTVTSLPAGGVDSNAGSTSLSHAMTGLTNGTSYSFTVTATNAVGAGAASSPSNSVTPYSALTTLSNGVPINNVSGASGSSRMFQITIPTGARNLRFSSSGGSGGDVDLYAKFNTSPTTSSYEYRSSGPSTSEAITIATPQPGTYYLMMYGSSGNFAGVSVSATYDAATNALSNRVAVNNLSGVEGSMTRFQITVPAGVTNVRFVTSGGSGNVDLYVKLNALPTLSSYLGKSDGPATSEEVSLPTPQPGTYHVLLYGSAGNYAGVSLVVSYQPTKAVLQQVFELLLN